MASAGDIKALSQASDPYVHEASNITAGSTTYTPQITVDLCNTTL